MIESALMDIGIAENYVQLMLDKTKNNQQLALTIFIKLFNELPAQLAAISNAIKNHQISQAKDITHMLHGSASFCGLLAIQHSAKDLEISLINVNNEAANQCFLELQQHVALLTNQQKAILAILHNHQ